MSNPYTSVSVGSSYNASPPADDASQVSSNQLTWAKHKTKLSDPLKTAIEAINSNNATAHGLHLGQTFKLKTANYTIIAPGDRGTIFSVTGTRTITLPLVATAGDGFPVVVKNDGSGVVTVDTTASELIDGSTSFTLAATEWALLTTDGVTWTAAIHNDAVDTSTPHLTAVKTADTAKVTDITLADDPHLSVTLVNGKYYAVELFLNIEVTGGSTPNFKFAWTVPAGSTGSYRYNGIDEAGSVLERDLILDWDTSIPQIDLTQNTNEGVHMIGTILAGAAGTFALQWAQDVSSGNTITLLKHSHMLLTEIG